MILEHCHPNFGLYITKYSKSDIKFLANKIYHTLLKYKVVVLRGQQWTPEEYIELCENIGNIWTTEDEMALERKHQLDNYKEIVKISNIDGVLGEIELLWHADGSHHPTREYPIRCLYGAKIPDNTANTEFADMGIAYDRLSEEQKNLFSQIEVLHRPRYLVGWEDKLKFKPLIRTHPIIGTKSISVDNYFTVQIKNKTEAESKPWLDNLVKESTNIVNTFTHSWQPGDLLLMDNNNVLHRRDAINHSNERCLWRITMDFNLLKLLDN